MYERQASLCDFGSCANQLAITMDAMQSGGLEMSSLQAAFVIGTRE